MGEWLLKCWAGVLERKQRKRKKPWRKKEVGESTISTFKKDGVRDQ